MHFLWQLSERTKFSRWSFTIEYPFIRHITCGMPVSNGGSRLHKCAMTSQRASDLTYMKEFEQHSKGGHDIRRGQ